MKQITLHVDASHSVRDWPHPEKYQNTTLRYTPAGDFPEVMETVIGRPKIIRLFITLDEVWDYRDDSYHWDYEIGVNRYVDDPHHYAYDWPLTVPSPMNVHIQAYLCSHAACADEVLLNIRRYEREVTDGLVSYEKYEEVFETVVAYYKKLCPNIVYIECSNEVELEQFGGLTLEQYYRLYQCAYRSIRRLNDHHHYQKPLKIGGFGMSFGISHWSYWQTFLELLSQDPQRQIDFYSMHEYHTDVRRIAEFCMRHQEAINTLQLPDLPLFMTEYGLRVGLGDAGRPTNIQNAAGEIAGLILASHYPQLKVFPWCTFHNPQQQIGRTMFIMNDHNQYVPTPSGHVMTMFHQLGDRELAIQEYVDNNAVATIEDDTLSLICANPGQDLCDYHITIDQLPPGNWQWTEYYVDEQCNNCLLDASLTELKRTKHCNESVNDGTLSFSITMRENAFCLCQLTKCSAI